jgi:uncharacterized DUF497 family protein
LDFEWDPAKVDANFRKHRVSFPYAARVLLDPNRIECLDEDGYDEERWRLNRKGGGVRSACNLHLPPGPDPHHFRQKGDQE